MKSLRRNSRFCFHPPLWKFSLTVVCLSLLVLTINAQSTETKPIVAETGEPTLMEDFGGQEMKVLTEEEYQKQTARLLKYPRFVAIKQKPSKLSPEARYGWGYSLYPNKSGSQLTSWILDGDEKSGYVLYADMNANGDLSDDRPLRFERKEGQHSSLFKEEARDEKTQQSYPVVIKLVIRQSTTPGESQPNLVLRPYGWTVRRGVIQVGHQAIAFGLYGNVGIYKSMAFDLNNDGRSDWDLQGSKETFRASEKEERHVNLGKTSYAIEIDRYGRSLTLKPLAEKLPERVFLSVNDPAPDFSFTDLEGKSHRLSDYRGKVALLVFWFSDCGYCQRDIPKLVELYEQYRARGLEIIGVNGVDKKEELQKFLAEWRMNWPQTIEENPSGPIHKLYQFYAAPTNFLIDRDGRISVRRAGDGMNFRAEVEKLLEKAQK